jgi:serine/threonine protein kinase
VTNFEYAKYKDKTKNKFLTKIEELPNVENGLNYLAPEYIKLILGLNKKVNLEDVENEAIDLWAVGCTIYEILTGRVPFKNDNLKEIYAKILTGELDWSNTDDISNEAKNFVKKLLILKPELRLGMGNIGTP